MEILTTECQKMGANNIPLTKSEFYMSLGFLYKCLKPEEQILKSFGVLHIKFLFKLYPRLSPNSYFYLHTL